MDFHFEMTLKKGDKKNSQWTCTSCPPTPVLGRGQSVQHLYVTALYHHRSMNHARLRTLTKSFVLCARHHGQTLLDAGAKVVNTMLVLQCL